MVTVTSFIDCLRLRSSFSLSMLNVTQSNNSKPLTSQYICLSYFVDSVPFSFADVRPRIPSSNQRSETKHTHFNSSCRNFYSKVSIIHGLLFICQYKNNAVALSLFLSISRMANDYYDQIHPLAMCLAMSALIGFRF